MVFDEYHFGAWRDTAKELFEGEDEAVAKKEAKLEYAAGLGSTSTRTSASSSEKETEFLPITTKAYLYLSGTPFKALATGEFIEEQIFNWTYTDEQRAKEELPTKHPGKRNPYAALPQMRLLTYQMPDELLAIASAASSTSSTSTSSSRHRAGVARRSSSTRTTCRSGSTSSVARAFQDQVDNLKTRSDEAAVPVLGRTCSYRTSSTRSGFLPSVASCHAMANLLAEKQNVFFHDYNVVGCGGAEAGIGLAALPPVRTAIGSGYDTKTITLSCGKLTTGVTVPQWSSILMLRNLNSPETYFQAAFRVQSPWSIKNPNGDNPNEEKILKPVCFVFDFAPTGHCGRSPSTERPVAGGREPRGRGKELGELPPVLAYDGLT